MSVPRSLSDISISGCNFGFWPASLQNLAYILVEDARKILLRFGSKSEISPRKPNVGQTPSELEAVQKRWMPACAGMTKILEIFQFDSSLAF